MTVRIATYSTCDLPAEFIARYGISVVPLYNNVGNQGFLDGIDMKHDEFYTRLPSFSTHPATAVPSPLKFHAIYQALADEGVSEILSIHISAALSGMVDVERSAAQETTAVPVTVFDSQQLSLGTGFLVDTAAKMAAEGSSVAEISAALNDQIQRSHVFAALDMLEFLKRSGQMNRYMAGVATYLQIKPIMIMHERKPSSERVRTRDRAMKRVVEMLTAFSTMGDFSAEGAKLMTMPWGIVSLVDLYVGFALFSCWIVLREKALLPSVIWVVLMMVLGFWAGAFIPSSHSRPAARTGSASGMAIAPNLFKR